ncbi:MAG: type II secretion system minor pseudopilin GspI [Candidatus Thiodiazotropha taylori]|nr:type II secretion system minor pseudopilin GspI [Candidatus Thiodiazotropha taylori]MCG7972494.1 type II secretion system minor pseudopilin GspI [Candidatus Thiodiazotropha taylori]
MSHLTEPHACALPSTRGTACSRNSGFTLLEILIALAILAIALTSIISVASNQSVNVAYLRDKTLAHWVAMNQMTELQVTNQWPATGSKKGKEEMGLQEWHWQREVSKTPDDRVRQVEIRVFRNKDDESSVTRLVSFLSQPIK